MLSVKNASIEDICEVSTSVAASLPSRLIVADYTRSEKVLTAASSFHVIPKCDQGKKKFTGFMGYLRDRKKVCWGFSTAVMCATCAINHSLCHTEPLLRPP